MNSITKFIIFLAKFIASIALTAAIIAILNLQGEKRLNFAEESYNKFSSSLMSMFPEEVNAEESAKTADNNEIPINEVTPITELEKTSVSDPEILAISSEDKSSLGHELEDHTTELIVEIRHDSLKKAEAWVESFTPDDFEGTQKPIKMNKPEDSRKSKFINKQIKNFSLDILSGSEGLRDFISSSIEIAVNEIDLDEKELQELKEGLKEAENSFAKFNINFDEIKNMATRVRLIKSLDNKAKKIGKEIGAENDCNYHKPEFEIDRDLRITSMKQKLDCHPKLAEIISKRIKLLPEWKKLSKK